MWVHSICPEGREGIYIISKRSYIEWASPIYRICVSKYIENTPDAGGSPFGIRRVLPLKKNFEKSEKRCWQTGDGVIVYPSARESGKQIAIQTDEVWIERREKPKISAQNGAWKILGKTRKKFLTNGGTCAKISESPRGDRELYLVNWIT